MSRAHENSSQPSGPAIEQAYNGMADDTSDFFPGAPVRIEDNDEDAWDRRQRYVFGGIILVAVLAVLVGALVFGVDGGSDREVSANTGDAAVVTSTAPTVTSSPSATPVMVRTISPVPPGAANSLNENDTNVTTGNSTDCCPADYTGFRAFSADCSSFFSCVRGQVVGSLTFCSNGTFFDQARGVCDYSDGFVCAATPCLHPSLSEATEPTPAGNTTNAEDTKTTSPLPAPSTLPSNLPSMLPSGFPSSSPTLFPSPTPSVPPTEEPSTMFPSSVPSILPTLNMSSVAPTTPTSTTTTTADGRCCPASYSGFRASFPDCSSFYQCLDGQVVTDYLPCGPGTVFSEASNVCELNNGSNCQADSCGQKDNKPVNFKPAASVAPTPSANTTTSPSAGPTGP